MQKERKSQASCLDKFLGGALTSTRLSASQPRRNFFRSKSTDISIVASLASKQYCDRTCHHVAQLSLAVKYGSSFVQLQHGLTYSRERLQQALLRRNLRTLRLLCVFKFPRTRGAIPRCLTSKRPNPSDIEGRGYGEELSTVRSHDRKLKLRPRRIKRHLSRGRHKEYIYAHVHAWVLIDWRQYRMATHCRYCVVNP
jgi:hypothetical protein